MQKQTLSAEKVEATEANFSALLRGDDDTNFAYRGDVVSNPIHDDGV